MNLTGCDRFMRVVLPLALVALIATPQTVSAASFAQAVTSFTPGAGAGFGQSYLPGNVLGPPNGTTDPTQPNQYPADLLSLGDGGAIVLDLGAYRLIDGPGADLTVFENPVQPIGTPQNSFCETAVVSVSGDGVTWFPFPYNFIPPPEGGSLLAKSCHVGFAGVNPTFSSPTNGISPFDPAVSGGDSFDLATIGVTSARYIRLQDTGTTGPTQTVDGNGDIVDDPGNHFAFGDAGTVGFDLDAIAAIHSEPVAAAKEWELYE